MSTMLSCLMMVTMSLGLQPVAGPAPVPTQVSCVEMSPALEPGPMGALELRVPAEWRCSTAAPEGFAILKLAGRQVDAQAFEGRFGAVLSATVRPEQLPALACVELVTFRLDTGEPQVARQCETVSQGGVAPVVVSGIRSIGF